MLQTSVHYFLHLGLPLIIAYVFFRNEWGRVYLILLGTMLVDVDHLLADPVFQPNRCSIGFHPLHSYYAIALYFIFLFLKRPLNLIGLGLLLHMLTDFTDCLFMYQACRECVEGAPAYELIRYIVG
ncbi:DUF6122 family protein [Roseivirga sp. BDSF3-8]|uniref:DUF6122 family protein n=1 Tax=Roseivirga sp. BDSF3-8 TaxID=3241598 RepID=UPI0035319BC4